MRITTSVTATAVSDMHRIVVYWDKQCNGAAATAAQLFDSNGNTNITAFRNLENVGRFRILYDKVHTMSSLGEVAGTAIPRVKQFNMYKKVNIPLDFSGATGAIAEIRSNNVGVLVFSQNTAANVVMSYIARVRYTDA